MKFRKPPLWASAFTILGLGVLGGLGTWQASKYIIKTSDIGSAACQKAETPIVTEGFNNLDAMKDDLCRNQIILSGDIDTSRLISLGPRVHDGEVGYHLYGLLTAQDSTQILVNFGWNKEKLKGLVINTINSMPDDSRISGVLVKPSGRNSFTPDNNHEKNEYYYIDTSQVAEQWNIDALSDYTLFAQNIDPKLVLDLPPAELSKTYLTPQTHLQYAAFWYFMALAMSVVFFLRFVIKKDD